MSRALIFSDFHFHLWRKFGTDLKTGLPRRLKEQLDVAKQIGKIIVDQKINFVINGGDLAHKVGEIPVEVTNFIHQIFEEWGVPIYSVMGNHDTVNRESPKWYESSIDYLQKTYWEGRKGPALMEAHDISIAGVDFGCIGNWPEAALVKRDIVVVHDVPRGSSYGDYKFEEGVDWKKLARDNRFVFFGHIHQNQQLAENCWVVGPPMHLTFGDTGSRGVYIVDTFKNSVEFIELDAPKFITVNTADEIKDDKNYYRVLNTAQKIDSPNVVSVIQPKFYEERMQSMDILGTIEEWAKLNNAPEFCLKFIKDKLTSVAEKTMRVTRGSIKTVEIVDFGSVGSVRYELNKGGGFTLVSGESDVFSSNGAGKTTMTGDAILWCLFGETTKGLTGDDVIRRGQKDCKVALTIRDDGTTYFITRTRSKGLIVDAMYQDGTEKELTVGLRQADRQKILEEQVLGFSKTLFMASCYFSQEDILTLTGLGDVGRNNLITDLLGFEKYDSLYEICFSTIKAVEGGLIQDERDIEKIESQKEIEKTKIAGLNERVDYYNKEIASAKKRIGELLRDIDVAYQDFAKIVKVSADAEISELENKQKLLEAEIAGMESMQQDVQEDTRVVQKRLNEVSEERARLQSEVKACGKRLSECERRIEALNANKPGERCDKCGSFITEDSLQVFKDEEKAKLDQIIAELTPIESELSKVNEEYTELVRRQDNGVNQSLKFTNGIKEKRAELRVLSKRIDDLRKKANQDEIEAGAINSRIKGLKDSVKEKEDAILQFGDDIHDIREGIKKADERMKDLDAKIKEIRLAMNDRIVTKEAAEFWKNAFSPKGIKSLLVDRFCNQFNAIANGYLSEISSGEMSITMSPTATLKSGEERNKLSMDIALDGYIVSYKSLSGGEKRRVDVSLCLALNEWVAQRFGIPNGLLGIIIFDEIFSFLDRMAEETIGSILYKEGCKKSIIVISHTAELSSYAGYRMDVVRRNGVSQLNTTRRE